MKQQILVMLTGLILTNSMSVKAQDLQIGDLNNSLQIEHRFKTPNTILLEKKIRDDLELIQQKKEEELQRELERQEKERKKNVKFNSYDVTQVSGITYDEMKEVLSESHYSNFAEISDAFVGAEREYGVNAFFLVAIAGLESGWNTSDRAKNGRNNIVGMAVYDDGSYGYTYESKYHCIMDLAKQLNAYYLTPGAEHYNGTRTSEINKKYSSDENWYKEVDKIGDELVEIYNNKFRNGEPY